MDRIKNILKSIITLLTLLLIPYLSIAQQTKKVTKEEKYRPKEVYYVLKSDPSIKEGVYSVFNYYNENLIIIGYYKNNLKDSIWTEYSNNKTIISIGAYKEDVKIDMWSYYDFKNELEQKYDYTKKEMVFIKNKEDYSNKEMKVLVGTDTILKIVDQAPIYIGGKSSINAYFIRSLIYPREAERNGMSARIPISFTIGIDGKVSNYKIENHVGYGMDDEALRVVKGLADNWLPAFSNGEKISTIHKLDIVFRIND